MDLNVYIDAFMLTNKPLLIGAFEYKYGSLSFLYLIKLHVKERFCTQPQKHRASLNGFA